MAMVPVFLISFSVSVERRASWRVSSTTSMTTLPGGTAPKSCTSAARWASSASSR